MTREEKAKWLSEFYAHVAEGDEMLVNGMPNTSGPDLMMPNYHNWTTRKPKRGAWVLFSKFPSFPIEIVGCRLQRPINDSRDWVYMEEP